MIRATDASADHHIVFGNIRGETCDLLRIELAIAVREHDVRLRRRPNAGYHRATIAAVHLMMDDFDVRIFIRKAIRNRAGFIDAPVVDDDDFISMGNARKLSDEAAHHAFDIRFLIVGGQKDADAGEARK